MISRILHSTRASVFAVLLLVALGAGAAPPVLGVIKFQDETGGMFMSGGVGRALTTMLTSELAARGSFNVVERQKLRQVMEEQDLSLSGRIEPQTSIAIGRLTGAQYLVTGTVTAFEEDVTQRVKSGFLGAGARIEEVSQGGYLAVDLRVIDTTTGEIRYARTVEGRTEGSVKSRRLDEHEAGLGALDDGPDAKAVRGAVIEIIDYLECEMVVRDACIAAFAQKEAQRLARTRAAIQLDTDGKNKGKDD